MNWPSTGIHHGVSESDYHSIGHKQNVLSKSMLWKFAQRQYKWAKSNQEVKQTDAMRWGSLVDCLALTPSAFDRDFAISPYDDYRTKAAQEWRKNETRTVITSKEQDAAEVAAAELWKNCDAGPILSSAKTQVSCISDIDSEYRLKCRIDILPEGDYSDWIFDLKTCSDLGRIEKDVFNFGYHVQAALYLSVWNALSPEKRNRFGFIFQESEPPFEVAVIELDSEAIDAGSAEAANAIGSYLAHAKDGNFPRLYDGIKTVSLPAWYRKGGEA